MIDAITIDGIDYDLQEFEDGVMIGFISDYIDKNLETLYIPDTIEANGLKYIPYIDEDGKLFAKLGKLNSISVHENNPFFIMKDGCLYDTDKQILFWVSPDVKELTLPDSVLEVVIGAFSRALSLETLVFSDEIQVLIRTGLQNCKKLKSVKLPKNIKEIGDRAFGDALYGCVQLDNIELPNGLLYLGSCAFSHASFSEVILPESLIEIGPNAFSNCHYLEKVTIPEGVEKIDDAAFWDCKFICDIHLPKSLKEFGHRVFSHCISLTNITVDKDNAFFYADGSLYDKERKILIRAANVEVLTLPDSLTEIANDAFDGCNRIKSISLPSSELLLKYKNLLHKIPYLKELVVTNQKDCL